MMLKSSQLNTFIATLTVATATTLTVHSVQAASLLYVTSDRTDSVLQYDGLTGKFLGVLDDGPHDNYGGAIGLALDPDGNLYLSRGYKNTTERYNPTTQSFEVFTKGGSLAAPHQFAFGGPDNDLYVVNHNNGTVQRFDGKTGVFESTLAEDLGYSAGLAIDPSGNLYISSRDQNKVYNYDAATQTLSVFAEVPNPDALLLRTDGFLYISQINRQFPGLSNNGNILRYKTDGTPFGAGGNTTNPTFIRSNGVNTPAHMAFGLDGNFYVADYNTNKVLRYDGFTGVLDDSFTIYAPYAQGTYGLVFKTVPDPDPKSIPEPSSELGVLALGAIGAGAILKRVQQHKVLDATDS